MSKVDPTGLTFKDKVIFINRVAKVVKGGRRFSFSALVVVGDGEGVIGFGKGKAAEVPEAIRKAVEAAKKSLIRFPLHEGTIPYSVVGRYSSSSIVMNSAPKGTGVIAGGPVRAVLEVSGIQDIVAKSLGGHNPHNTVRATIDALARLRDPEEVLKLRGKLGGSQQQQGGSGEKAQAEGGAGEGAEAPASEENGAPASS